MPQFVATALHRFDINLRTSVILGYVGVIGIGHEISSSMQTLNYDRGMAWALIVLVLCVVVEMISGSIRARLLGHAEAEKEGLYGLVSRTWERISGVRGPVTADIDPSAPYEPQRYENGEVRTTPYWDLDRVRNTATAVLIAALIVTSFLVTDLAGSDPFGRLERMPSTIAMFFPPGWDGNFVLFAEAMLVTIQIGLAATLLGMIISVPIGIVAAKNVVANRAVNGAFRTFIVCVRAFPELILAIIFIVITGLGPVPGVLALAIGSIGLLSKLLADSIEETDPGPQEAMRANGASPAQVFFSATLRQSLPAFVAHILYQLDVNIRAATLLGIVGAGGIGYYLLESSRVMKYDVVTALILMILLVVLLVEGLSVWTRRVVR